MEKVTMREIAKAIYKPESTVYRWRKENPSLFQAVKEYTERHIEEMDKKRLTN